MKDWLNDFECSCGATYDVEVELELEDESLVVTSINPKKCPKCGKKFYAYAEYSVFLEENDDPDED